MFLMSLKNIIKTLIFLIKNNYRCIIKNASWADTSVIVPTFFVKVNQLRLNYWGCWSFFLKIIYQLKIHRLKWISKKIQNLNLDSYIYNVMFLPTDLYSQNWELIVSTNHKILFFVLIKKPQFLVPQISFHLLI
jgi:hypothetical protein